MSWRTAAHKKSGSIALRCAWALALAMLAAGLSVNHGRQARAADIPDWWRSAWPRTDFSRLTVPPDEIISGGPGKDGIPAIDQPKLIAVTAVRDMAATEPMISIEIEGDARAYPLRVLLWHEIANDTVGGTPVAITYCPLCNSAVAFDRRVDGAVLDFGVSGMVRHSDMVMYDRQTESWWQQFLGEAIAGEHAGARLRSVPVRVEALSRFRGRFPAGLVMVPEDPSRRPYGRNPYPGYDGEAWPFLYKGSYDGPLPPLARVVVVGNEAWSLELLRQRGRIEHNALILTWASGQSSPLDATTVAGGRDIGNVVVQRRTADGLEDVVHDVSFAFAFLAFRPNGTLHVE